jgi:hypothetical protein
LGKRVTQVTPLVREPAFVAPAVFPVAAECAFAKGSQHAPGIDHYSVL